MKNLISPIIFISTIVGITVFGCSVIGNSDSDIQPLENMEFTRSAYTSGNALVLRASSNPELGEDFFKNNSLSIQFSTSGGDQTTGPVVPWPGLTDKEMVAAIKDGARNIALLRIKKADQESAYNNDGELVRSEEAINKFVAWAANQEKLRLIRISELTPWITIQFTEGPTLNSVSQVRSHENVELMEPNSTGSYTSVSDEPTGDLNLAAVIFPNENGLSLQPGQTVTATFEQSDGTTLTATAKVVE